VPVFASSVGCHWQICGSVQRRQLFMGLWLSFQPGGTGADSNRAPLLLSAEAMLEGFEGVFRGCYVGRYPCHNVGIVMNVCIPQKGLSLHLVP
jgi:hypothetical protein